MVPVDQCSRTPMKNFKIQDEMRVGQKNKLTYRWARKGSRPRATHDQRTQSTYLFGAVCPERGAGAALVLPACNFAPAAAATRARTQRPGKHLAVSWCLRIA